MAASKLSFATFNLYNLNMPGLRMYRDPDGWSQDEYDRKIAWTARILREGNTDVWGFQEHWHNDALEAAVKAAGLDATHEMLVPDGHSGGKIQCAALVRKGLLVSPAEWIIDFPEDFHLESKGEDDQTPPIELKVNAFSRPVLTFEIEGAKSKHPIRVFVCHFKSKNPTSITGDAWYKKDPDRFAVHKKAVGSALSTIRRTAEATALRMILNTHLKGNGQAVVVLGDLNDGVNTNTLNIVTDQPTFLTDVTRTGGGDQALYSVATMLLLRSERDVYYSHIYKNHKDTLDHILVSEEMYDLSSDRQWGLGSAELINDHLNRDDHKDSGTGDHGIVRAEFVGRTSRR